ncbi:indolepyruvate ferredoxin oxidoreductase family protein [Paraburkholderia strydomiana]|uniref:indolepyruvate ferredoxin oxidoreductase family protein n=1 Tax=Paraburkholderia strydomiana TaxID=1245417 RepID=UPI0038B8D5EF
MNNPVIEVETAPTSEVSLDDKYRKERGYAYMSGSHALIRVMINQRIRDNDAGLNTAGFVSGYRGSPLAGFDTALWSAEAVLKQHQIKFLPAINEDLAATAVWGTQQLALFPQESTVEGVFSMWYGKGPGVDRSGDALKHGNGAGTSALGGVLVAAADDHTAKSSTFGHQSEQALIAAFIPVLYPASVQDYLDFGVLGIAMGRYSGLWVGLKCVSDVIETSAVADVDPHRIDIRLPDKELAADDDLHIRSPDVWAEQEPRIVRKRLPAALAFCWANRLNSIRIKGPKSKLGIVCAGKAYNDVMEALRLLGLSGDDVERNGLAVLKIGMVWPLEPTILRDFAAGLDELLVVEEKRPIIEQQIKDELYSDALNGLPLVRVSGKGSGAIGGEWNRSGEACLLRSDYELTPVEVAGAIVARLRAQPDWTETRKWEIEARLAALEAVGRVQAVAGAIRKPFFCSGCPHNTSTRVPEGSRATAGIGCHYMASSMDRRTESYTHMGGEGVPWVAQAQFSTRKHIFANIGDGTYFHSGSLAIRQAVAARVSMTFKILYNDAAAMTGGQPVDGELTVDGITRQVAAEGVRRIAVVSDDIEKYRIRGTTFAAGTTVHDRTELDAVQRNLREYEGVSVLVYDQTCASEKRRRRKKGTYPDPAKRVAINSEVCEGCGDCSVQSNCLSVEPLDTPLGRKRQINQSSCNKDFSCVQGFCPSFVSVEGGKLRSSQTKRSPEAMMADWPELPYPASPPMTDTVDILINGVGGTGVVTIGNLLGMAAHLEGHGCTVLDMAGLAQKGGAVWSHVRLASKRERMYASRIPSGSADLIIGCDLVVTAAPDTLSRIRKGKTRVVINGQTSPTSAFVANRDWQLPEAELKSHVESVCGDDFVDWVDAQDIARRHLGDTVFSNAIMLGFVWQQGLIPLARESIERAIELNGQAVKKNKLAFQIGRWLAVNPARFAAGKEVESVIVWRQKKKVVLDELIQSRVSLLAAYQSERYAREYETFVSEITAQVGSHGKREAFILAVAEGLYKLMAYKDEYEVARLYSLPGFKKSLENQFEGDFKIRYYLAPPLLSRKNEKGELIKKEFGPWLGHVFPLLARLKILRGTPFDPFGHTAERKRERALIREYRLWIRTALTHLADKPDVCIELAKLPDSIRGYGHVKERAIDEAMARRDTLLDALSAPAHQWRASA